MCHWPNRRGSKPSQTTVLKRLTFCEISQNHVNRIITMLKMLIPKIYPAAAFFYPYLIQEAISYQWRNMIFFRQRKIKYNSCKETSINFQFLKTKEIYLLPNALFLLKIFLKLEMRHGVISMHLCNLTNIHYANNMC